MGGASSVSESERLWTPANIVTLVRICLVPVFVVALITPWPAWLGLPMVSMEAKRLIAAGIFILISCTDWLDGYLARSRHEVTSFGKFMDPLADKILVTAALLALVELAVLPAWPVLIILAREFIVSGIRMVAANQGVVIAASWYGKAKTVTQIVAIVLFIVKGAVAPTTVHDALANPLYVLSWLVMLAALVLTVVSMLDYFVKARHLLGFSRKGEGAPASEEPGADRDCDSEVRAEAADEVASDGQILSQAEAVVRRALTQNVSLATAESLTGGLIAGALTSVPGSSGCMRGSVVSYASEVKRDVLGVSAKDLSSVGAVSEEVARAMASGAAATLDADISVAVTGIAGPGGEEPGKPVGTVWAAVSSHGVTQAQLFHFEGDRAAVRKQTVSAALDLLLEAISEKK